MDFKSFSKSLASWLNNRFRKEFKEFEDYDDIIIEFFLCSVYRGIVENVFEAQPVEDVCEWLLKDEEALEMYFSQAVRCAQRVCM
jgi:hypothetical protein